MICKINKRLLICLLCSFEAFVASAQYRPDTLAMDMYPPSATALMTYTDYPVSYMTGTPEISIPLYTIQSGTLVLPLTLKYHIGDYLKANQSAGPIGAGWSLSTDFVVTRKIKGLDDLTANGYPYTGNLLTEQASPFVTRKLANETLDGEPDRFYFQTFDGNGNFYILDNGNRVEQVPSGPENIQFTPGIPTVSGTNDRFVITDGEGRVYYYYGEHGASDKISANDYHWTAWHCRKITDDTGKDNIDFSYIQASAGQMPLIPQGVEVYDSIPAQHYNLKLFDTPRLETGTQDYPYFLDNNQGGGEGLSWYADDINYGQSAQQSSVSVYSHLISRIDFRGGYVTFNYSTHYSASITPLLVDPFEVLDEIRVYTSGGILVHTYSFEHNTNIPDRYGVLLTRITVDGTMHYEFSNPGMTRGAGSSDFWGYELYDSNRRPHSIDCKIHLTQPYYNLHHDGQISYYLPSGPVDVDNVTSSIYKSGDGEMTFGIRYPTGGLSQYTFEYDRFIDLDSNVEKIISSRRIKRIRIWDTGNVILKDILYEYGAGKIIRKPSGDISSGPINTILSQKVALYTTEPFYDLDHNRIEPGPVGYYRKRVFLAGTVFDDDFTSGHWVRYPEVTEIVMSGSTPLGKTVYKFDIEGPYNAPTIDNYSSDTIPCHPDKHYWYAGTPKSVSRYCYTNIFVYQLQDKVEYLWKTYLKDSTIRTARIWPYVQAIDLMGDLIDNRIFDYSSYSYSVQHLEMGHNRLLQEKHTQWLDDGVPMVTLKEYKYDNPDSLTLGRIITHFPGGTTQTEVFVHDNDYAPLYNSEKRPTHLTEYIRIVDGVISGGWAYSRNGSRINGVYTLDANNLPASVFRLSSRLEAGVFDGTGTPTSSMYRDSHYSLLDSYQYDLTYKTPSMISRRGQPTKSFIWGYGGLYPTKMMVENQLTTAEYSPLIGMTSLTAPDGIQSNYIYNTYGRLVNVKTDGITRTEYSYSFDSSSGPGDQWIKTRSYVNNQLGIYADDLTWYNGIGLPSQTIEFGPQKDVIRQIAYDAMLRDDANRPLPFATTNRIYRYYRVQTSEELRQYYTSLHNEAEAWHAYFGKKYENSPLGRLKAEWEPGVMGQPTDPDARKTFYSYVSNSAGEVRNLSCTAYGTLQAQDFHPENTLFCTIRIDPDSLVLKTYSDALGRVILERRSDGMYDVDTYYVYDPMGRLRWVVTPGGVVSVISNQQVSPSNNVAKQFCYYYEYDNRGNIVFKQIPGAAPIHYTYDAGDRILTMVDGNLSAAGDTLTYSYDSYGREVGRDLIGSNAGIISRTTYDVYPNLAASPFSFNSSHLSGLPSLLITPVGKVTHTQERILGTTTFASKDFYYDRLGRVIQEVEYNPESSLFIRTSRTYDLHGNVLKEKSTTYSIDGLWTVSPVDSIETQTSFDRRDRPTEQYIFFRGTTDTYPPMLYYYDDLGRLTKTMRGADLYDSYKYNIQGRETDHFFVKGHSNGDTLFVSKLRYYDPFNSDSAPRRNGSISSISSLYGNTERYTINYTYDGLGRVIQALDAGLTENYYHDWDYRFSDSFTYDKNSNILTENYWFNAAALDDHYYNTNYTYAGNHRNGWSYDANGNITAVPGQISSASYNLINLPLTVTPTGKSTVTYHFAADGTKLSAAQNSVKYLFLGPFKYKIVGNGSPVLETVTCSGDIRIERTPSGSYERRYYVRDHLGSTRLIVNRGGTILMQADFTPYGRRIENEMFTSGNSPYLWCGKEYESFIDIPWYDSEARFLTTDGIFTSVDPMSECFYHISPYSYCAGNPINKTDPTGTIEWPLLPSYNGYSTRKHDNDFGQSRGNHLHGGIDINYLGAGNNDRGAPILATHSGKVTRIGLYTDGNGGGNRIRITSNNGMVSTFYMHLDELSDLKIGDSVVEGQQIGTMGRSGGGNLEHYGSHLHYELFVGGERVDPVIDAQTLLDPQALTGEPIDLFVVIEPAIITAEAPTPPQVIVINRVNQ